MKSNIEKLATILSAKNLTICSAESCTGGLIAANLTALSGASNWYRNGFITYSNNSKHTFLNVSNKSLAKYGAVSSVVAQEMAQGALEVSDVDFAIAVTGIAGPTGGSLAKPVGLVYFGFARRGSLVTSVQKKFTAKREEIRIAASFFAIKHLLSILKSIY